ncbi:DUF2271 domain-containing protein [Crateriforma conspicua]|uniref:DUF2271 domain-containing protein n=1 Tax=Crateriforma conspicua TaxID=2527996 RepID=UPI00118CEDE7|nr:DUF2271 domain-containing protein [Crateriforma conspicua]QDV65209.1 hypothetical protein Mal65_43790 [Crateriforma conspicua]
MPSIRCTAILFLLASLPSYADESGGKFAVSIEIPRLNVSEYHRPYVAVWIQDENKQAVANLAVWYQMKRSSEGGGTKWLPDLRQWWRRSGRSLDMPVDGVSGATRPAGKHSIELALDEKRLTNLSPGKYSVMIEASREVGGRELLELPFDWPATTGQSAQSTGKEELGVAALKIQPSK